MNPKHLRSRRMKPGDSLCQPSNKEAKKNSYLTFIHMRSNLLGHIPLALQKQSKN
jgi:hypothetical protein